MRSAATLKGTLEALNIRRRYFLMDNWTFGVTMMVCGMGGTILTLYVMSLIMTLLGKFFPFEKEQGEVSGKTISAPKGD